MKQKTRQKKKKITTKKKNINKVLNSQAIEYNSKIKILSNNRYFRFINKHKFQTKIPSQPLFCVKEGQLYTLPLRVKD